MDNNEFILKCKKEGFDCVTETTSTGTIITKIIDSKKGKSSSYWEFSTNKAKVNIPSFPKDPHINPSSPYEFTNDILKYFFFT